jgi:hypothetical protein
MAFCPETLPFAEELLDMLCDALQTIRGYLNDPPSAVPGLPPPTLGLSLSLEMSEVTTMVEEAFSIVLGALAPKGKDRMHKPFYELRGVALLAAVAFMEHYGKQGFEISLEDIMEHPSLEEQVLLLGQKGRRRKV